MREEGSPSHGEGWEARDSIPVELREAGKPREEEEGKIKITWKTTSSPAGMNTTLCPGLGEQETARGEAGIRFPLDFEEISQGFEAAFAQP